jgi:hypothetical protein
LWLLGVVQEVLELVALVAQVVAVLVVTELAQASLSPQERLILLP